MSKKPLKTTSPIPKEPSGTGPASLRLAYDLLSLPTAQHKAGLVGLLMMLESLQRREIEAIPVVLEKTPFTAVIEVSPATLQNLFDDLFAAEVVEVTRMNKWSGTDPKRIEEESVTDKNGKTKTVKRYVYDVIQPSGAFLKVLYPDGAEVWLKLWRDMLWKTLRGIPKTRGVYEERAQGKPSSEAAKVWKSLMRSRNASTPGTHAESIASSVFIGAQDRNAEIVPFLGRPEDNLLLHFTLIPCLMFSPRSFKVSPNTDGKLNLESIDEGYVVAIPEPARIDYFTESCLEMMATLDTAPAGYRPKASVIDVPAEGGLEYLYHLTHLTTRQREISDSLASVEVYHLRKKGDSVRMLAAERLTPSKNLLRDYELLREQCRNPDFKSCRIRSLLAGKPWYAEMGTILHERPSDLIIFRSGKTPAHIPFFAVDVRKTFRSISSELEVRQGERNVTDTSFDDALARRIHSLITQYVRRRAEEKSGEKYENFKDHKNDKGQVIYPKKYLEALEKVCSDAFLAMRGRNDQAFVEYFTGTICSVPQFLPPDEFVTISSVLMTDPDRVKTLAMLALSANSYISA